MPLGRPPRRTGLRLVTALLAVALAACHAPGAPSRDAPGDVLATVDGVPIREVDVEVRLKASGHDGALTATSRSNLLEAIIREQLISRRALELGLDADPDYRETVRQVEAQAAAVKRRRLAEVFSRREVAAVEVGEAELQRYYQENRELLFSEVHVQQILRRSQAEILQAQRALQEGASFEQVAAPGGGAPGARTYDLGYLKWPEVPDAWRAELAHLAPGAVSPVLRGGGDRFWIIRLVERRRGRELPLETIRAALLERLRTSAVERRREAIDLELRQRATIVYGAPQR